MARHVAALRQPDAGGVAAEVARIVLAPPPAPGPAPPRARVHEGQEPVGRPAGDDLELARVAVLAERAQEVGVVRSRKTTAGVELVEVEPRDVVEPLVLSPGARRSPAPPSVDQPVEVAVVARDEQLVRHHRDERRGQRHGQPVVHAVGQQAVQHAHEGDVGLGQGLEEPVLLEELRVLRMPDVRKVRVQHRAPISDGHGARSSGDGRRWRRRPIGVAGPALPGGSPRGEGGAADGACGAPSPPSTLGAVHGPLADSGAHLCRPHRRPRGGRDLGRLPVGQRAATRLPSKRRRGEWSRCRSWPAGGTRRRRASTPAPRGTHRRAESARTYQERAPVGRRMSLAPPLTRVPDTEREAGQRRRALAQLPAQVLQALGLDVPVGEQPLRVLDQEADAIDPVALGEEEPLLLEQPRGGSGAGTSRTRIRVFLAQVRADCRDGGRLRRRLRGGATSAAAARAPSASPRSSSALRAGFADLGRRRPSARTRGLRAARPGRASPPSAAPPSRTMPTLALVFAFFGPTLRRGPPCSLRRQSCARGSTPAFRRHVFLAAMTAQYRRGRGQRQASLAGVRALRGRLVAAAPGGPPSPDLPEQARAASAPPRPPGCRSLACCSGVRTASTASRFFRFRAGSSASRAFRSFSRSVTCPSVAVPDARARRISRSRRILALRELPALGQQLASPAGGP